MADEATSCFGPRSDPFEGSLGLRIGAIFIIGSTSLLTTLFPVVTGRSSHFNVPPAVYDFAKYFGSGVIIATAFIHLLAPGIEELGSPCLNSNFQNYPFALAFAMIAMFMVFLVELLAFRIGSAKAQSLAYDPHTGGHHHAAEHVVGSPAPAPAPAPADSSSSQDRKRELYASAPSKESDDVESVGVLTTPPGTLSPPMTAQASEILGVMILEFGVIFHSVIIGITLGTTNDFKQLFVVIIFHQMFEGLGLGSRLAALPLSPKSLIPYLGGIAYALVTPIGLAIGIGIRHSYNEDSATANYVTGTFDSVSAGVLLYTGLVELLAHEFIFNNKMRTAPIGKVLTAVAEMFTGAGIMALLGRWA